jgi:hypothetical protein
MHQSIQTFKEIKSSSQSLVPNNISWILGLSAIMPTLIFLEVHEKYFEQISELVLELTVHASVYDLAN